MQKFENINKELTSPAGAMNPLYSVPEVSQPPYNPTVVSQAMKYQAVYPEIFYKLQPYIMMVCDQMDFGPTMPNMETIQHMTDNIYKDVCRMYPDLAEYARSNDKKENDDPPPFDRDRDMDRDIFERPFRRRGMFRDIIDILLLSELFGRRRRFF